MEARLTRAALLAVVLLISTGARHRGANFIVETPDPAFAKQVAQAAEKFRQELALSWLGKPMPNWSQPCMLSVNVGPNLGAGGATTFMFDRGEVFGWRMTIQGSRERVLDSVLPHEITHMIFASHFRQPLPRWADEGGATSVEHISERTKYRNMLYQFLQTGRGIAFNQMFAMRDYPADVMPLYAQGYSLAEYLIQRYGRRKYIDFVGSGINGGDWAAALRQHYDIDNTASLQQGWLAWVRRGSPLKKSPSATPEALAAVGPRSGRSAALPGRNTPLGPGVVAAGHEEPATPYAPGSVIAAPTRPNHLAARDSALPGSSMPGWQPSGQPRGSKPVAPPAVAPPQRDQVARPTPIQRPRQVILQWSGR